MLALLPLVGGLLLGWLAPRRTAVVIQVVLVALATYVVISSAPDHGHTRGSVWWAAPVIAALGALTLFVGIRVAERRRASGPRGVVTRSALATAVVLGAAAETSGWLVTTLLARRTGWRHDISALEAVGRPHAWIALIGEVCLGAAVLLLALMLHRSNLDGDHVGVATVLLVAGGIGMLGQALAREGGPASAAHGPIAVLAILALCAAPLVLAAVPIFGRWSAGSAIAAMTCFAVSTGSGYPAGVAQRGLAMVLATWVAVAAIGLAAAVQPTPSRSRIQA